MTSHIDPVEAGRRAGNLVAEFLRAEVERMQRIEKRIARQEEAEARLMRLSAEVGRAMDALAQARFSEHGESVAQKRLERAATTLGKEMRLQGRLK
ncbi:MAG: hypothetical protein AB7O88_23730 [Reyranellaceae bacterium]